MPSLVLESMIGVFGVVGVPRFASLVVVVALRRSGPAASASHGLPVFRPPPSVSFLGAGCQVIWCMGTETEWLSTPIVVWMWRLESGQVLVASGTVCESGKERRCRAGERAQRGERVEGTAKKQKNSIYRKPKKVEVGGEEEGECFKALSCLPSGL